MAALNDWDIVDANNNATPPDGWPENTMQYSEVNNTGRAVQGTLKRYFADVNGSLVAGGVADAYTVSLNETGYTSYFTGMYFACQINSDNTGATTMDVNGIGAQNVVNRDGSALNAGALQSGGIYQFVYDGTNFQVVGSIAGASVSVDDATFSNSNDPDLVDTDVAINVGAADPDTAQHLELGPSDLQSKGNATTATTLRLNQLGGDVQAGAQSGSGSVELYDAGQLALSTFQAGVSVSGDVTVSSPPVAGDAPDTYIEFFDLNETTRIGYTGFSLSSTIQLTNEMRGGAMQLLATDNGGTQRNILLGDPDVGCGLYYNGSQKIQTAIVGMNVQGQVATATPPTTEFVNTRVELYDLDGSDILASVGFGGSNLLQLRNYMHAGDIQLLAQDAGGTDRVCANANPDGAFDTYYTGAIVTGTLPAASGGLQVNNTLTGGGFERVLTTSDLGSVGLQITFLPARVVGYSTTTPTGNGGTTGWQLFDMSAIYPAGVGEDYAIVWCQAVSNDATPLSRCNLHLRPVGSTANTTTLNLIVGAQQSSGEAPNYLRQDASIYFIELDANGDFEYYNLVNGPVSPGAGSWILHLVGFISL